jgi:hypothetical protein
MVKMPYILKDRGSLEEKKPKDARFSFNGDFLFL